MSLVDSSVFYSKLECRSCNGNPKGMPIIENEMVCNHGLIRTTFLWKCHCGVFNPRTTVRFICPVCKYSIKCRELFMKNMAASGNHDEISFKLDHIASECFEKDIRDVCIRFEIKGQTWPIFLTFALDTEQLKKLSCGVSPPRDECA